MSSFTPSSTEYDESINSGQVVQTVETPPPVDMDEDTETAESSSHAATSSTPKMKIQRIPTITLTPPEGGESMTIISSPCGEDALMELDEEENETPTIDEAAAAGTSGNNHLAGGVGVEQPSTINNQSITSTPTSTSTALGSAPSTTSTSTSTPTRRMKGGEEKSTNANDRGHVPTIILMIGMAGSGKSTLVHRTLLDFQSRGKRVYSVNLDPAVRNLQYPINIDIRDTINYKDIMKKFKLGPNGAIMTSLNLFATRFDQVLELIDKRAPELDYIVIDTPGQIEVFNWSASGQIICETLAVAYPTVACYVVDTVRCTRPVSFMSNMLYCCSILYKTKLPFVCAFNKIDVVKHDFIKTWLSDFQAFGKALSEDETTYLQALARSMSLALEEFYKNLNNCGVSATTGEGLHEFQEALDLAVEEYNSEYLDYLQDRKDTMKARRDRVIQDRLEQFEKSLDMSQAKDENLIGNILDRCD